MCKNLYTLVLSEICGMLFLRAYRISWPNSVFMACLALLLDQDHSLSSVSYLLEKVCSFELFFCVCLLFPDTVRQGTEGSCHCPGSSQRISCQCYWTKGEARDIGRESPTICLQVNWRRGGGGRGGASNLWC